MKKITKYFLKGIVIIAPLVILTYVAVVVVSVFDKLVPGVSKTLSIAAVIVFTTIVGFLFSSKITRGFISWLGGALKHFPHIHRTYTSIRKLGSLTGTENAFETPVLIGGEKEERRVGFITKENLEEFGIKDSVAVYIPQSFSFSGEVVIVKKDNIIPIEKNKSKAFTLAISGGLTSGGE